MKKSTKRLFGGLAIAAGAVGAMGAVLMRKNRGSRRDRRYKQLRSENSWARPGMKVTFRARASAPRETSERTFQVVELLPSGRVLLDRVAGEHAEKEFEPLR